MIELKFTIQTNTCLLYIFRKEKKNRKEFLRKYFKDNFVLFEQYVQSYDELFQIVMDHKEIHEHHEMH